MKSQTRHIEGSKFETRIGAHYIVCDQPASEGGLDAGVSPPELLLAALGSCAGHYALEYLRARALPLEGLAVEVSAETAAGRLADFRVTVRASHADEKHRQGILRAVKACLIYNTLTSISSVESEVADAAAPNDSRPAQFSATAR